MNTETIIDQAMQDAPAVEAEMIETPINESTEAAPQADAEDDKPWPKKAVNAMSRRDKQIGKLRAQHSQVMQELEALRSQMSAAQPQKSEAPTMDQFDDYAEYVKALAKYEIATGAKNEFEAQRKSHADAQSKEQEDAYIQERSDHLASKANEIITGNPEYGQLLQENIDILESYPAHIERAFLEADNGAAAFVVLAKEGKLESLNSMSPTRAAMEIGRAEDRYAAMNKPKTTKAPQPMASAKGTGGSSTKSLNDMSPEEIMKWARAK